MECLNHPEARALDRCAECGQPFCASCLVELHGDKYCEDCKMLGLSGRPGFEAATVPCPQAGEALKYAIVGILCCGIVFGPIAIVKGLNARKIIDADPRQSGWGKATAAMILGVVEVVTFVVFTLGKLNSPVGRHF